MGRNDWAQTVNADDLSAALVSPKRGRGWKVFSGLLVVGGATFALAFYLPLYRAHQKLTAEYSTLAQQTSTQRSQLQSSVEALKRTSEERDALRKLEQDHQAVSSSGAQKAEKLQRELDAKLASYERKKQLRIERSGASVRLSMLGTALISQDGKPTAAGKKALCQAAAAIKLSGAPLVTAAAGVDTESTTPGASAWESASARAGNAADLLVGECGLGAKQVEAKAADPSALGGSRASIALLVELAQSK